MDSTLFIRLLHESNLEEGRTHIQEHSAELVDLDVLGDLLADEALKQLYNPFLSLKLSEQLIFLGDYTHHRLSHALGLKAKGDALVQIRHYQAALEALDAAGEEFLLLEDERNWARSRISWIMAAVSLGRVEEALHHANRAREVFLRLNEPYWVCVIDHNTALVYKQVGRYQDSNRLFERLLTIYPTVTDQSEVFIKRAIAMAKESLAINLSWLGRFEQAYRLQEEAQAAFVALAETNMAVNSEINLGNFDYTRGYYGSALRRYYQAQDILSQHHIDNPKMVAELKVLIANTLVKLNRADEACELAYAAVEIYRQLGTSLHATNTLREYATALAASGRLDEARAALYDAEILFERGGLDHYASVTRLQRAELLLEMGEAARAFDEARILKGQFEAQGLVARAVRATLLMVGALVAEIRQAKLDREQEQRNTLLQKAAIHCNEAILQARQHDLQEELYKSEYFMGQLLALQSDAARAEEYYGAAIAQIEHMLDDLVYDLSPSFLQSAWVVYEDMIGLCLQQGRLELAFSYLEQARSMALRQHLATSKAAREEQETEDESASPTILQTNRATFLRIRGELKIWQDRYRDYSVLLTKVDTSVSPTVERGVLEAELKRCEAKLSELFERLYLHQATAKLKPRMKREENGRAYAFKVAELRQRLSSDQLLLAYFLYRGRLIIFAITAGHLVTFENPDGMSQLKRLLPTLHAHLQPGGWADPHDPPQQGVRQMLKKLYDLLIAPAAAFLPSQSRFLTVVPYGPLHTLPFHALYDGSRFLIEEFQVNYLPASSLLTASRGERAAASRSPLIFGYSGHGHLQRAIDEAKTLAAMLGGRCYLEEEATIARLIEEATGSPIIHLATHGHSRLDAPNFSSVLLAEGQFNAIDAFSLNLEGCELVTLSGCETGLAMSGGGDEQLGLSRAFLAVGADTLVISLWPVEDDATNELMQLFYQNLLRGESKAQALRTAQRALLHGTKSAYAHPYYWAAFRLVGGVGPLLTRETTS
jgi:tetratricopeptide (TPR) repeat protein